MDCAYDSDCDSESGHFHSDSDCYSAPEDDDSDSEFEIGDDRDSEASDTDLEETIMRPPTEKENELKHQIMRLQKHILWIKKGKYKLGNKVSELEISIRGLTSPEMNLMKQIKTGYEKGDPWSCFMSGYPQLHHTSC